MAKRKLSDEDVKHIRESYYSREKGGFNVRTLSKLYRVSETCIHHVLDRKGAYKS